jgi:transposase InsO family protein
MERSQIENPMVKRVNAAITEFSVTERELKEQLSEINIYKCQTTDENVQKIINHISKPNLNKETNRYFLRKNILMRTGNLPSDPDVIVLPANLVPICLAYYHLLSHVGGTRLFLTIRQRYCWPKMRSDCENFVKGCILCSIMKHKVEGKGVIGIPRTITGPRKSYMLDQVTGLSPVEGYKSYLTITCMHSTYVTAYPIKNGTSEEVSKILENIIIRNFGTPKEFCSNNAHNLQGPEVRKLLAFYGIKHTFSTPYSPTSHGLVENQNKNLTVLLRLFSEQFKTAWLYCITLAVEVMNTLPRISLMNKSPYFIMFGEEPHDILENTYNFLDLNEFIQTKHNNINYAKLVRQYLLAYRKKRNEKASKPKLSYPVGTLVYLKDLSQMMHRKGKPIYKRTPLKVIAEYANIVYLTDIYGCISRHSKRNLKKCGERSEQLFFQLPLKVKLILGDVMGPNEWEIIRENKMLPEYLENVTADFVPARVTRQNMAQDSHLIELPMPVPDQEADQDLDPDPDDLENLPIDSELMNQLNSLHADELLTAENLSLDQIPKLFNRTVEQDQPVENVKLPSGIIKENILPHRLRSHQPTREVSFDKNVQVQEFERDAQSENE